MAKRVLIVAGPNGAGKTTFARNVLREHPHMRFLNADIIAERLSPGRPDAVALEAGRNLLARMDACVANGESFVVETTLAGRSYLARIHAWKRAGYEVFLAFLSLPRPEIAIERVKFRVSQGGHHIPPDVVRRRFFLGLDNVRRHYTGVVDAWQVFDASGSLPILTEEGP